VPPSPCRGIGSGIGSDSRAPYFWTCVRADVQLLWTGVRFSAGEQAFRRRLSTASSGAGKGESAGKAEVKHRWTPGAPVLAAYVVSWRRACSERRARFAAGSTS
jgi:hypothetical protein